MPSTTPSRVLPRPVRMVVRRQVVRYRTRGMHPEDALLISYPKSGMTWLRFLLAHALTGAEADFDSVRVCIPPLGRHAAAPLLRPDGRIIRSHEPVRANHSRPGQRIVYLVRDGRDVALSYLAHERRYQRYAGEIGTFLDHFVSGRVDSYGPWHDHVLGALAIREQATNPVLLVKYEELRADAAGQLRGILEFLGCQTKVDLKSVVAANTKERMRVKETASRFLSSQRTDGSPFVRPDRASDWSRDVAPVQRRWFEQVCGPALEAACYEVGTVDVPNDPPLQHE